MLRDSVRSVVYSIHIGDRNARQFLFRHTFQAADIDAVHFPDRRFIAHSKNPYAAMAAKIMVIFVRRKNVASQFTFAGDNAKTFGQGNRRPKAAARANGTIAAETGLR